MIPSIENQLPRESEPDDSTTRLDFNNSRTSGTKPSALLPMPGPKGDTWRRFGKMGFCGFVFFWEKDPHNLVESKKHMYITQVWRIWIDLEKVPWSQDFEKKARDRTNLHVMPEYLKYASRSKTSEIRSLDPSRCIFAAHDFCNSSVCLHCGCLNAAQKERFTNLAALSRRKSPKI